MMRFLALGLALLLCASCGPEVIGPVLVENRSSTPLVIRASGNEGETDMTWTLALPANSKVLVDQPPSSAGYVLLGEISVLNEACALRTTFTMDTGTEGGRIVVNADGSIDRLDEGIPARSAELAEPTQLCTSN